MPALSAKAISSSVLPTPEKTIFDAGIPAASALRISPSDTVSAPAPTCASVVSTAMLELALHANATSGASPVGLFSSGGAETACEKTLKWRSSVAVE